MPDSKLTESFTKNLCRSIYIHLVSSFIICAATLSYLWRLRPFRQSARLIYGGARNGYLGGTLVKVHRLQAFFPEHLFIFNSVYVLSNCSYLTLAAINFLLFLRIPIILNQNGVYYPAWYSGDWSNQNTRMKHAYHKASYVFWQSEFCRRAADHFLGHRSGPGEILYNAVDTRHFSPFKNRQIRPFTFLITGKIESHQYYRIESTFCALSLARSQGFDLRLIVAGYLENPQKGHALATQHGVINSVTFIGPYTQQEAPFIYNMADAYVTMTYMDNCPNTVLEAMSCGLPVLYSASGGVPELVGPDCGIGISVPESWTDVHVPPSAAIAQAMIALMKYSASYSLAARTRALEYFDIHKWINRHSAIFNSLLSL